MSLLEEAIRILHRRADNAELNAKPQPYQVSSPVLASNEAYAISRIRQALAVVEMHAKHADPME